MKEKGFDELYIFDLCQKTKIDKTEMHKYLDNPKMFFYTTKEGEIYLCEIDENTNTRVLMAILKRVNTIKNIILFTFTCGIIGTIIAVLGFAMQ